MESSETDLKIGSEDKRNNIEEHPLHITMIQILIEGIKTL